MLVLECLERRGIAEEAGHVDEDVLVEGLDFGGVLLELLDVVREVSLAWSAMRRMIRRLTVVSR